MAQPSYRQLQTTINTRSSHRPPAPSADWFDAGRRRLDRALLERVVRRLAGVGSAREGFRATGTPEELQVAEFVADEMAAIGLEQVALEPVPVDAWRFISGSVRLNGGQEHEASSLAGSPPTPPGGIAGDLVFVGDGRRRRLDRLALDGRIALVDWRSSPVSIGDIGLELTRRGVRAIIVGSFDRGARFQGADALGTSVGRWHAAGVPCVTVTRAGADALLAACRDASPQVAVELRVEIDRGAQGRNVVGILPGRESLDPLVVGAHHDGWFYGAFDNASGVAGMLAIAKALRADGGLAHPVIFCSHTAEEYGRLDDESPWCYGAWHQVHVNHPDWSERVPFFLDVEASGRPELPLLAEGPIELRRWATQWCRRAARAGILPSGWRFAPPVTGTDQWPFQLAGIPGLSFYNWHTRFQRTDYHTNRDTVERLNFDHLHDLATLYTALVADADRLAWTDTLLEFADRQAEIGRHRGLETRRADLLAAATAYAANGSRRSFARLAREGFSVDCHGETCYLPEQSLRDAARLDRALELVGAGAFRQAAAVLRTVGTNYLQPIVSAQTAHTSEQRRLERRGSWAEHSHLTRSPDLYQEIASLSSEPGARPNGEWITQSLRIHRDAAQNDANARIDQLVSALNPASSEDHPQPRSTS